MKRFLATCDDCPDFREVCTDEVTAERAGRVHGAKGHGADLLHRDINAFIAANTALAHWYARRAGHAVGETYAEIYADALLGLWDAARRWDPSRCGFPAFAGLRITGAIADGRRVRDPLSRTQRRHGDIPNPISLDATLRASGCHLVDLVPDTVDPIADWHDDLELTERHDALIAGIDRLPPRVAYVIREHLAGRTLTDIAVDLDVTESRACQLKHEAIARLRQDLTAPSPQGVTDDLDRPARRPQGSPRRPADAAA